MANRTFKLIFEADASGVASEVGDLTRELGGVEQASKEADSASTELDSTWDRLQQGVDELGNSIDTLNENLDPGGLMEVADAAGNLERVLIGTKDVMGVLAEQFGVNLGPMEDYVGAAADVAGGMEGIIGGGTALAKQLGPLAGSLGPVIAATWGHVAALTAQAAAFIVANAPIILIVGGLALLAAGIVLLIRHWDDIKPKLQPAIDFFEDDVVPAAKAVWEDGLKPVVDFVRDNWPEVATLLLLPFAPLIILATDAFGIRSATIGGFQAIVDFVRELPGEAKEATLGLGTAMADGIVEGFGAIADKTGDMAADLIAALRGGWNAAIDWADQNLKFHIPGVSAKGITIIPDINFDPDLSPFKINAMAKGGVIIAGDNPSGIEAVVPLERAHEFGFGRGNGEKVEKVEVHNHFSGFVGDVGELLRQLELEARRQGRTLLGGAA